MTLRRIKLLIEHLPPTSALATVVRDGPLWSLEAHLLDDLRMVWTSTKEKPAKPAPGRFPAATKPAVDPEMLRKARARMAERQRLIDTGIIT